MFRRGPGGERGSILIMSAVGMVVAVISAALAIDIGFLAHETRVDQKVADLAAIDSVRSLPADPTSAAQQSATRNGFPWAGTGYGLVVEWAPTKAGPWSILATDLATAAVVRVSATSPHKNFFPFVAGGQSKTRSAVAGKQAEAAFSVGSTLASLDTQSSALDSVLGGMLGLTAVQMSAVGYDGLATGNVALSALQTKLLAMGLDVGTPTKLLSTSVKVSQLFTAAAQVLSGQGAAGSTALAQLNNIPIASISGSKTVNLGKLVSLGAPGSSSALDTTLNVFELVSGSAQVANGTNFVSVPGINILVPGVANVSVALSVIEPAQTARGPVGTVAKNSQVVLRLQLALLPVIGAATVIIDFSAAAATATLAAIECGAAPPYITLAAATSGATVGGDTALFLGTITATGSLVNTTSTNLQFNYPTQFRPPVGPTPPYSQHVGVATLDLTLATVHVTGTGAGVVVALALDPLLPLVLSTVSPILQTALQPVLQALGLDLAGADVSAIGIYDPPPACTGSRPGLVQ